jgi:hypothetical protein
MLAFPPKHCSVCGNALTVHRVVHGFCDLPACLVSMGQRRVAQRQAEERAAIEAAAESHRQALLAQYADLRSRGIELVIVPGFDAVMQPMNQQRRDTLRTHLNEVLSAVPIDAAQDSIDQRSDAAQHVINVACATCRGYCCRKGGDSAYIKTETIARVRRHHPNLDNEAIADTYLDAVPKVSATDSCIFHGQQGCTLPRDFRADICNDYHCSPLETWLNGESKLPTAVVVIEHAQVARSALVDEHCKCSSKPMRE